MKSLERLVIVCIILILILFAETWVLEKRLDKITPKQPHYMKLRLNDDKFYVDTVHLNNE